MANPPKLNFRAFKKDYHTLTDQQAAFVTQFGKDYNAKTATSKNWIADSRLYFCDWINSLNFKMSLKDFTYSIVSESSQGAHFTDVDGNTYIDIGMGYGVGFHGHNPPYVKEAVKAQVDKGFELGPQCKLTAETAQLIHELTGVERVTFCMTGTEAVMASLRIARAATGRNNVVIFANSFHGTFDGVLARKFENQSFPLADGTLSGMVEDILILPYAMDESLQFIKDHADELAAVLIEPVQSRTPELQPVDFLKAVREVTAQSGTALIFDETVTGFRMHPGGIQALFDIQADLVIYGKSLGGGMPISAVCGKAAFMKVVDGGHWQYGDESQPDDHVVFFAGTYFKHPLSMAGTKASLLEIKKYGTGLQDKATGLTTRMADKLNSLFKEKNAPVEIRHFGSMFRFISLDPYPILSEPIEMDLMFYQMMHRGVYTWEKRICYLSIAHTEADVDEIVRVVGDSIDAIRTGGFSFSETD